MSSFKCVYVSLLDPLFRLNRAIEQKRKILKEQGKVWLSVHTWINSCSVQAYVCSSCLSSANSSCHDVSHRVQDHSSVLSFQGATVLVNR